MKKLAKCETDVHVLIVLRSLESVYDIVQLSKFSVYDGVLIPRLSPLFMDNVRGKEILGLALVAIYFFPSFIPLSSSVSKPSHVYFRSISSISFF
jgi:hypothetical protein